MTTVSRHEAPLPAALLDELCLFWERIFATSYDEFRPALGGAEAEHNRDVVWVMREEAELAGTCHLTTVRRDPALGGLGEVATVETFRRRGIARELCGLARNEFRQLGGHALFLGTGNPEAARVYHRLGWRKLAGTNVMALIVGGETPERSLAEFFQPGGTVVVEAMTPAARIPMIPLLVSPHDEVMLDANAGMVSTKFAVQHSCMGLFPRYDRLTRCGWGAAFCASTLEDRLVGLATAKVDDSGLCAVDGFVHRSCVEAWEGLIRAALDWGSGAGATGFSADVGVADEDKRRGFERLGFATAGRRQPFVVEGRSIDAIHMMRR